MNIILQKLRNKQDLESFLIGYVEYMETYFQNIAPLTEDKTYQTIIKLTNKIFKSFPKIDSIKTLSKQLEHNVVEKINDKFEDDDKHVKKNEDRSSIKSLLQQIETLQIVTSKSEQANLGWVRKALLDELKLLKQDIDEAQQHIYKFFSSIISQNDIILCSQGFLKNSYVFELAKKHKSATIKIIKSFKQKENLKENQINLKDAARQIKKCNKVIISAELILKNGNILASNGALLVAVAAKNFNIPVIVISRSYCLSNKIVLSHSSLHIHENPLQYFDIGEQSCFKVHIAKSYDLVDSRYISSIITQKGLFLPENSYLEYNKLEP